MFILSQFTDIVTCTLTHRYVNIIYTITVTWIATPLFHVLVSPSHGHSHTLNTICHVSTHYTRYCYFMLFHVHVSLLHRYWDSRHYCCMFVNHWYTDTLLHWIPLHGYSLHSYFMFLHHCYIDLPIYMHWLSLYVLLRGSLFISHELLLHGYSCIPVTWLFPVTDIDIPVTGHISCWYTMCETKCHVDPSHGGHL